MSAAEKMLLQLLEDGSDMQLVFDSGAGDTEPEILPGHTQILRLWSQVMRTAIDAESSASEDKIRVPMPGTRKADWLLAMSFLYPMTPAPVLTWDNLEPLLAVADKYCMSALTHQLATFLRQNMGNLVLSPDSKLFVWNCIFLADRYNQVDLAKQIINAATDINGLVRTNPMRQSPTYKGHKLSADTLQHLMIVIPAKAILLQPGVPYCSRCKAHQSKPAGALTSSMQLVSSIAQSQQHLMQSQVHAIAALSRHSDSRAALHYPEDEHNPMACPVCKSTMVTVYGLK